jgi:ADP-ribose pyrophosphatase
VLVYISVSSPTSTPDDVRPLHTFFMNPGRASWPTHLFISTQGLQAGNADTSDPAEQVQLAQMPLADLDEFAAAAAKGELPPLGAIAR